MSPKANRLTIDEEIINEVRLDDDLIVDPDNAHNEPDIIVSLFSLNSRLQIRGNTNLISDDLVVEDDVDVINNDSFDSASYSEDDLERIRRRKLRQLDKEKRVDECVVNMYGFYCGQEFGSSKEVKDRIYMHSIETRRELKMSKNDKVRVTANYVGKILICGSSDGSGLSQCVGPNKESGLSARATVKTIMPKETELVAKGKGKGKSKGRKVKYVENICPCRLYVAKENDNETWVVRTLVEEHKCLQSRNIKAATSTFYSTHITDQIMVNPNIPIKAVQDQLQKQFALGVSKMKAFRAKTKADVQVKGDYKLQYVMLRDYILELQTTNVNTTVRIEVEREPDHSNPTRVFKRIYVCLDALKEGYRACQRDLLGLDGAFMKGPFPGRVLTAVGRAHSDMLLNNMCEVLNGKIVDGRDKPIITALEFIKEYCMKRIVNVGKVIAKTNGPLTPSATRLLNLNKDQANKYTFIWNGGVRMDEAIETWVHPCYWLDTWKQVYSFKIEPINGNSMWRKCSVPTTLTPLVHHKQIGRPRKKRKSKGCLVAAASAFSTEMQEDTAAATRPKVMDFTKPDPDGSNKLPSKLKKFDAILRLSIAIAVLHPPTEVMAPLFGEPEIKDIVVSYKTK
ncbi:hypothetical protein Tco_0566281 [Tanacetum coccineum]